MKRRGFIQKSTTAAAGTSALAATASAQDSKKPNLLVIHCDELNFRTIGCFRDQLVPEQALMWGPQAVVETPNIDGLAKEGAICTKMYAATPVCSPSRSSFLSGQYPQNTPVVNNNVPIADGVISFAETLGKAGWSTGYGGKWHLDGSAKPGWAPERKFGFDDNRYMFNRGHWKQFEDGPDGPRVKARNSDGKPSYSVKGADEESFATDFLTTKAIDFIDTNSEKPWCYMLSIPDPHGPDTVRAPYDSMYAETPVEQPRTFNKDPDKAPSWAKPVKCGWQQAGYFGMMKCIDDNVGRLVESLRESGQLDNTIFVFTADHGDMRAEHHRQNKGIPLEASAKIPFVIRYPKKVAAGAVLDQVTNTVDFLPTMLGLMDVETAGKEEGRSFTHLLANEGGGKWENVTFIRSTGKSDSTKGWLGAVTPRHKLIVSDQDEPWLLDLEKDPDELINFIDQQPDVAKTLAQQLLAYAKKHGDSYADDPNTGPALKALAA
ncbi:MAG: arylsulfatase A-like enzyme [Verrucomicrobiales bacterium]|jgi:arylsulfatase A-like enzyme